MGLCTIDGVCGQGASAPGVCTAYAVEIEVDVEVDEVSSVYFVRMLDVEVFLSVVPGADA